MSHDFCDQNRPAKRLRHSKLRANLGCDVPLSKRTVGLAGRAAVAVTAFLVAPALSTADEIYKSVDAQGHVVFSDRPNTSGAQKTAVAVQQADAHEAARLAKQQMLLKAEDDQRKKQEMQDSHAKEQQDATRKAQCDKARERYNFLKSINRLYTPGADGNREYYTDTQLDAMREEAGRTMNAACGT
jgi:hypothetical protein